MSRVLSVVVVSAALLVAAVRSSGANPPAGATKAPVRLADGSYVGEIRQFASERVPAGWLECDGNALPIAGHSLLFEVIGNRFGSPEPGKFLLPDLRGAFVRGWNHGKKPSMPGMSDPGAATRTVTGGGPNYSDGGDHVGTNQPEALHQHKHVDSGHAHGMGHIYRDFAACGPHCGALTGGGSASTQTGNAVLGGAVDADTGQPISTATETRPGNISLMYCIRDSV